MHQVKIKNIIFKCKCGQKKEVFCDPGLMQEELKEIDKENIECSVCHDVLSYKDTISFQAENSQDKIG